MEQSADNVDSLYLPANAADPKAMIALDNFLFSSVWGGAYKDIMSGEPVAEVLEGIKIRAQQTLDDSLLQ
ncbi:hypothetical protein [Natronospora cellulosivora (SeqCode)]